MGDPQFEPWSAQLHSSPSEPLHHTATWISSITSDTVENQHEHLLLEFSKFWEARSAPLRYTLFGCWSPFCWFLVGTLGYAWDSWPPGACCQGYEKPWAKHLRLQHLLGRVRRLSCWHEWRPYAATTGPVRVNFRNICRTHVEETSWKDIGQSCHSSALSPGKAGMGIKPGEEMGQRDRKEKSSPGELLTSRVEVYSAISTSQLQETINPSLH